jgi:hypothetical protein
LHAAFLQAPHVAVDERDDSQPLVSGGVVSQSANPFAQPVYVQLLAAQPAPTLVFVSHERPHPPQLAGVVIWVSQPFVSGGVLLQSAKPAAQLVYLQVGLPASASHVPPLLWIVSHEVPHELQVAVAATCVSQPSVSGAAVLQSTYPGLQPV